MGVDLPRATVVHALPGRTRLRFPTQRGHAAFFDRVRRQLLQMPAVHAVWANPATASLLLVHAPETAEAIGRAARDNGLFEIAAALPVVRSASAAPRGRDSLPRMAPLNLVATGFIGLGLVQAMRGRFHGNAAESLWNAYLLHALHGRPVLSVGLVGLGLYQLATGNVLGSGVSLLLYGLAARNLAVGDTAEEPG
jgi:hypothetical protein